MSQQPATGTLWTLEQLAFVARWVIWPLLRPFEEQLEELKRLVSQRPAVSVYTTSAPQGSGRQECNVSTLAGAAGMFVGTADIPASLKDAALLYRAVGGERIRLYILSSVGEGGDDYSMQIEIQLTDSTRAAASSFPVPIVLTIGNGSDPQELSIDQALDPGDCLVACSLTDWTGIRVDASVLVSQP